ncbi:unnamed protein product [Bursaphelenchus okinawaensis]|uniref:MFS domain-containing protein n=1 Tax=Bursaphelenchus okinawaensis TaxID=465554 RepID=A0A811L0G7_9BILA|nr:unnamed protein product [Bursaphelenchus okinawaensis]CAG9114516.1 unnamed protein product [Bursaphelenchus okinawaensis]
MKTDWRSIYLATIGHFLLTFRVSTVAANLWPYMKLIDPHIRESFFGMIVSLENLGTLSTSLIGGVLCNKLKTTNLACTLLPYPGYNYLFDLHFNIYTGPSFVFLITVIISFILLVFSYDGTLIILNPPKYSTFSDPRRRGSENFFIEIQLNDDDDLRQFGLLNRDDGSNMGFQHDLRYLPYGRKISPEDAGRRGSFVGRRPKRSGVQKISLGKLREELANVEAFRGQKSGWGKKSSLEEIRRQRSSLENINKQRKSLEDIIRQRASLENIKKATLEDTKKTSLEDLKKSYLEDLRKSYLEEFLRQKSRIERSKSQRDSAYEVRRQRGSVDDGKDRNGQKNDAIKQRASIHDFRGQKESSDQSKDNGLAKIGNEGNDEVQFEKDGQSEGQFKKGHHDKGDKAKNDRKDQEDFKATSDQPTDSKEYTYSPVNSKKDTANITDLNQEEGTPYHLYNPEDFEDSREPHGRLKFRRTSSISIVCSTHSADTKSCKNCSGHKLSNNSFRSTPSGSRRTSSIYDSLGHIDSNHLDSRQASIDSIVDQFDGQKHRRSDAYSIDEYAYDGVGILHSKDSKDEGGENYGDERGIVYRSKNGSEDGRKNDDNYGRKDNIGYGSHSTNQYGTKNDEKYSTKHSQPYDTKNNESYNRRDTEPFRPRITTYPTSTSTTSTPPVKKRSVVSQSSHDDPDDTVPELISRRPSRVPSKKTSMILPAITHSVVYPRRPMSPKRSISNDTTPNWHKKSFQYTKKLSYVMNPKFLVAKEERYDMFAVVLCCITRMIKTSSILFMISVGGPYMMTAFGWTSEDLVKANIVLFTAFGFFGVIIGLSYMKHITQNYLSDRRGIVISLIIVLFFYLITYPYPFYSNTIQYEVIQNGTILKYGCPKRFEWCSTTPMINPWLYFVTMALCVSIGIPLMMINLDILYSKVLGNIKQGTMQGIFVGGGELINIVGPITLTAIYEATGVVYLWMFNIATISTVLLLWLIYYKRMISATRRIEDKSKSDSNATVTSVY